MSQIGIIPFEQN